MPIFRTTAQIFLGEGEFFDINWYDSPHLHLPPTSYWDYSRELQIEDINIWEVIAEPWDVGIYAAWDPFAEFFLIRHETDYHTNPNYQDDRVKSLPRKFQFETYYGKGAESLVFKRAKELGVKLNFNKVWVEPEHMWLYSE